MSPPPRDEAATSPFRGEPAPVEPPPEPDLEPVVPDGALLALLMLDGALLGVFGLMFTPLHVGAIPLPLGALLSILVLPWLVLRAGDVDSRPGLAGMPLIVWAAVVGVLGIGGPGGDVLLPETWQSLLLFVGGVGAGLLALRAVLVRGQAGGTR